MQENFEINAVSRDVQGKGASRRLRREGLVPGIIYGGDVEPQMFATRHNELLQHLDNEAFYSHILTVNIDGTAQKVVLKDLQRHPAKPFVMHVDLLRVSDKDRIKMHVPLHFLNEETCPGVKAGGKVSHLMTDVEVICAAKDLPEYIEVDLAGMNVGDTIHLSELNMPEGVEVLALAHDGEHDTGVVAIHAAKGGAEAEEETAEGEEGGEE
jgi:large subunit ribosomal protein L25